MQSYKLSENPENRLKKSGEIVGIYEERILLSRISRKGMMQMRLLQGGTAYCNLSF